MSELRTIELPCVPPDHYLRWLAFWRQVEQAMGARPALERHASTVAAPFLRGEVAEFISTVLVTEIRRQASEAKAAGLPGFAPTIEGPDRLLRDAIDYVRRRGRWIDETVSLELIGVPRLEPELVELRRQVIRTIEDQLDGRDPSLDAAMPSFGSLARDVEVG